MLILVTILTLATALTIGLIASRFVRPFAKTEVQGVKLGLLVTPLLTLTVLLLTEVEPSVPPSVTILMIIVTAAALGAIATFTLPYISRRVQIGALVVMLMVFSAMHWTIYEMDHNFEGVVQVEPTDLRLLTGAMSHQFAQRHPDGVLPCDERGEPT